MEKLSERLDNNKAMTEKIEIYIPTTEHGNEAITEAAHLEQVKLTAGLFSMLFGGATYSAGVGAWVSDKTGELIEEPVTIVYSHTTAAKLEQHIEKVIDEAERLKNKLTQEAVLLVISGVAYFV